MWSLFYASASRHCWTFSDIVRPLSDIGQCCYRHIVGERLAKLLTSCHMSLNLNRTVSLKVQSVRSAQSVPSIGPFYKFSSSNSSLFWVSWPKQHLQIICEILNFDRQFRMVTINTNTQNGGTWDRPKGWTICGQLPRPSCELGNLTGQYVAETRHICGPYIGIYGLYIEWRNLSLTKGLDHMWPKRSLLLRFNPSVSHSFASLQNYHLQWLATKPSIFGFQYLCNICANTVLCKTKVSLSFSSPPPHQCCENHYIFHQHVTCGQIYLRIYFISV